MNNFDKFLFGRNLLEASRTSFSDCEKIIFSNEDKDINIPYYLNKHGYRSEEFNKNNEVLVLGCSQTYGSGMLNEFTWPEFFCNNINKKYSRIASRGDSINGQVYKAFKYFEEIGNPKIVLALFPLYRLEYPMVPDKFISPGDSYTTAKSVGQGIAYFNKDFLKFSKAPHDPAHTIPKEFVVYYNFMFLKMLEQYCESHNIKFIWSIYDENNIMDDYIEENIYNIFKNFIKTSKIVSLFNYRMLNNHKDCESEEDKEILEKCNHDFEGHELYDFAADFNKKKDLGHWNIHTHYHIYEKFIERYNDIKND